jgi:hypothetical protein
MRGCDVPEDREAVEVHTYDAAQFQEFHPESLAVGEAVWAFLEKAAKVGYRNGNGFFCVCVCVRIRIPRMFSESRCRY